jgi:hypothetical protein
MFEAAEVLLYVPALQFTQADIATAPILSLNVPA